MIAPWAKGLAMCVVLVSLAEYLPFAPARLYDFRAFYCAGKAIAAHTDPYREEPIHACERTTTAPGVPSDADDVTVPAPFPGYVLALFVLLAPLAFPVCALVWITASIAAVVVTIKLLQRVIDLPASTIGITIFLPAAIVAVPLGQLAPFVGCAIAVCAYALKYGRWRLAAVGALATSLDPAVAAVLCAALLFAVPASRVTIVIGVAALWAVAVVTLGVDTNLEYMRRVVQAHAAGNIAERSQFSATHFAWAIGLGSRSALVLGEIWYGLAAAIGIWIAVRLRRKYGLVAIALVPPAFAVFGGLYVHFSQVALAIPAYLMTMQPSPRKQPWLAAGIFVLAIPWLALAGFPPFAVALVVSALVYAPAAGNATASLGLGLGSAVILIGLFLIALVNSHVPSAGFHTSINQNQLSETSWSRYVEWRDAKPNLLFLLLQTPTIVAFTVCLNVLIRSGFTPRDPSAQPAAYQRQDERAPRHTQREH